MMQKLIMQHKAQKLEQLALNAVEMRLQHKRPQRQHQNVLLKRLHGWCKWKELHSMLLILSFALSKGLQTSAKHNESEGHDIDTR